MIRKDSDEFPALDLVLKLSLGSMTKCPSVQTGTPYQKSNDFNQAELVIIANQETEMVLIRESC